MGQYGHSINTAIQIAGVVGLAVPVLGEIEVAVTAAEVAAEAVEAAEAAEGAAEAAEGVEEAVTGFRAVSTDELQAISNSKMFEPSPFGSEVKYFSNTQEQAFSFGERMYGSGNYGVVQGDFPTSAIGDLIHPATEGPGFVVPNVNLSSGTPTVLFPTGP